MGRSRRSSRSQLCTTALAFPPTAGGWRSQSTEGRGWISSSTTSSATQTSPVTFNAATNADPVWTPDGAHFVFKSLAAKTWHFWWTRADGAGGPRVAPRKRRRGRRSQRERDITRHSPFDLFARGSGERCGPVGAPVGCERSGSSQGRAAGAVSSDSGERDAPRHFLPMDDGLRTSRTRAAPPRSTFGRPRARQVQPGSGRSPPVAPARPSGRETAVSCSTFGAARSWSRTTP